MIHLGEMSMSDTIQIPKNLKQALGQYDAAMSILSKNISDIMNVGDAFFYNYTKHGVPHIQAVLDLAERLIPDDTRDALRPLGVCVLVMSIMVHDIGMFIHYSGLRLLLKESQWQEVWDKYRRELWHMADSDMERLFGPCREGWQSRRELPGADDVVNKLDKFDNEWQNALCGEFLRRHHHELAEYIVLKGFPINLDVQYKDLFAGIDLGAAALEYRRLIGLIARSHGESLDVYYKSESDLLYDDGFFEDIPVYYCMAVLRMADLLDAGEARASWLVLQMRDIKSQISMGEFIWNRFVRVSPRDIKNEVLKIIVRRRVSNQGTIMPITSSTFLKIESLIRHAQQELDSCWRYITLFHNRASDVKYKLSIRIIESNILDLKQRKSFSKKIVLKPAKLCTSQEVLSLLTAPLYGDHPTYGVRELLQNAVDACRERRAIEGEQYNGKVTVRINRDNEGKKTFSITDNGIGMTEDVILNYFLKVGSTFRNSEEWKTKYGERGVLRNGQFGIGVLAAFLLGETVHVWTKSKDEPVGCSFTMRRDAYGVIDIRRDRLEDDAEIGNGGTRIEVDIDNPEDVWTFPNITTELQSLEEADHERRLWRVIQKAMCDYSREHSPTIPSPFMWYWPDSMKNQALPTVEYYLFDTKLGAPIALEQVSEWFDLPSIEGIERIRWWPESIKREKSDMMRSTWYNNIFVQYETYNFYIWHVQDFPYGDNPRLLSVEDTEKGCSIDLARTTLCLPTQAEVTLFIENVKLCLARMIMGRNDALLKFDDYKPGAHQIGYIDFLFSKQGYTAQNSYVADCLAGKNVWLVVYSSPHGFIALDDIPDGDDVFMFGCGLVENLHDSVFNNLIPYIETASISVSKEMLDRLLKESDEDMRNLLQELEQDYRTVIAESAIECDEIRTLSMNEFFENMSYRTENYRAFGEGKEVFLTLFSKDAGEPCACVDILKGKMEGIEWMAGLKVIDSRPGLGQEQSKKLCHVDVRIKNLLKLYFEDSAGKDPWIPYEPMARRDKFPKFFDPEDDMYKYMKYVSKYDDRDTFYTLEDFGIKEESK